MRPKYRARAFALAFSALGCCALLAFANTAARADVTTEQNIAVVGVGIMAAGNLTGTTKTAISGTRSRTDSDIQLQSRLVKFLARNAVGPTAQIVLLDADRMYRLNMNKKEFTEQSFEDLRARLQKALNGGDEEARKTAERQPAAIDESKCEWLEPKADVKRTGEKTTVAGFDAERVIVTAEQPCKDKETGSICEIALTMDEWLAPKFGADEEVQKFHKAYAQKLGLDAAAGKDFRIEQDANERAKELLSRYKGVWSQVTTKMQGLKGYPVKASFALGVGGEQCKQAQSAQESKDKDSSGSSGGVAGQAIAKLGSLFHHKKDDPAQTGGGDQPAAASAAAAPSPSPGPASGPAGTVTLITISSELVSVSAAAIPAEAFTLPTGFKKVEPRT